MNAARSATERMIEMIEKITLSDYLHSLDITQPLAYYMARGLTENITELLNSKTASTPKTVTIEYHTGGGQEVDHTIEAQVCPNCGKSNIDVSDNLPKWFCMCWDCYLCGPEADTIPAAVELWNRITMS